MLAATLLQASSVIAVCLSVEQGVKGGLNAPHFCREPLTGSGSSWCRQSRPWHVWTVAALANRSRSLPQGRIDAAMIAVSVGLERDAGAESFAESARFTEDESLVARRPS